jgi:hypothetical protein
MECVCAGIVVQLHPGGIESNSATNDSGLGALVLQI